MLEKDASSQGGVTFRLRWHEGIQRSTLRSIIQIVATQGELDAKALRQK